MIPNWNQVNIVPENHHSAGVGPLHGRRQAQRERREPAMKNTLLNLYEKDATKKVLASLISRTVMPWVAPQSCSRMMTS